jgi:thiol-disulfide isomerase/thioredoxin
MYKQAILCTILILSFRMSYAQNELSIGKQAPTIQFQKAYPSEYNIPKNKPIILDFWATWCGPCVAGLIENNKLVKKYQNQIEFIAITDTTSKKVAEFIQSRNFNHTFLIDKDTQTFSGYGISAIPRAFIIDGNAVIQWEVMVGI